MNPRQGLTILDPPKSTILGAKLAAKRGSTPQDRAEFVAALIADAKVMSDRILSGCRVRV